MSHQRDGSVLMSLHRRRHECTPIARVVLAFIVTAANFLFDSDNAATAITASFLSVSSTRAVV